ncbi:MAG TPA: sulfatase-like hydrolase/transferase [Lacunisphaera sp.]|nr:sulfatase-like hydrolase/transferase [Lacunisphaera sp.]
MVYPFAMLARCGTPLMRSCLAKYNMGQIAIKDVVTRSDQVLPSYFANLRQYCDLRQNGPNHWISARNSRFTSQNYRWDVLRRIVDRSEAEYLEDKTHYLRRAAAHYQKTNTWILDKSWRWQRAWSELAAAGFRHAIANLAFPFSPHRAEAFREPLKQIVDAEAVVDRVLALAKCFKSSGSPFLIWSHFMDCHIPYSSGEGASWIYDTKKWLRLAGHSQAISPVSSRGPKPKTIKEWNDWAALYDAAILFIDCHIGRLKRQLVENGLGDTMIIVTSDHGEELGEHGDNSHRFRLYEHNTHVNTFYYHPDFKETRVEGFSTLMDIAPTAIDLAGFVQPQNWEGDSLQSLKNSPRKSIVLETTFGSPSDARTSPVYLAARQGPFKLMYNEQLDPRDRLSKIGVQLFDLRSDPKEQQDRSIEEPDTVEELMQPIQQRLAELRGMDR